jgi:hypothetical protein
MKTLVVGGLWLLGMACASGCGGSTSEGGGGSTGAAGITGGGAGRSGSGTGGATTGHGGAAGTGAGGGGTAGASGSGGGHGGGGSGTGGSPGTGGAAGTGGGGSGTGGSAGTGGAAGTGGGATGATGGGEPSALWDSCSCTCTCSLGGGSVTGRPCRPASGQLCTCDGSCTDACTEAGLGSLTSATGSCVATDVPVLWSCQLASYHGGDGCDCGCGVIDPDCPSSSAGECAGNCDPAGSCAFDCTDIVPTNNATCTAIPPAWTCSPVEYGSGNGCDCGCGAPDLDCLGALTSNACDTCNDPGSCAKSCADINTSRNYACGQAGVPAGWTCAAAAYGSGDGCDCGCGVVDPDCFDATRTSCDTCVEQGSCEFFECEDISPTNNAICD